MPKRNAGSLLGAIHLDKSARQSLHAQLYEALRDMILNGKLAGGERLPASRVLAEEMGISRTTVISVFDRLTSEGLLTSKVGAGSFVKDVFYQRQQALEELQRPPASHATPPLARSFVEMTQWLPPAVQHSISQCFSTAIPAIDAFPLSQWSRIVARHNRSAELTRYNSSKGSYALRRSIANHLHADRGLVCDPAQIYITCGAQQAVSFLGQILLDPGDTVWIENPGSRLARFGLLPRQPNLIPVPVDDQGLDVSAGLQLAANFKLASVTPSHQQPRGVLLSLPRRLALLEAAEQANGWILEDDYDGELFYQKQPLPTLFSIAESQRVIYVGTFSKTIFPALRLGYFVVPEHLVDLLDKTINSFLPAVPLPLQAAVAEFIESGYFATHIRRTKRIYQERHQALCYAGEKYLAEHLKLVETETGFHLLAMFNQRLDERALARAALDNDVLVRPLTNYCAAPVAERGIALGFGCTNSEIITAGCQRLALAFEHLAKTSSN